MHLTFFGKAEGMKKGLRLQPRTTRAVAQDLDGDFYAKMLESDQKKYDLVKENRERKKQGLEPLQGDRKGNMSASANVYTQFLSETKQILIDKARELGLEYVATGTNLNGGDMNHFKKAVEKEKEAVDKEISKYKQQKQEEINQLDEEIKGKKGEAQEAGKTAEQAKEDAEKAVQEKVQAENEAKQALQSKDEATREERIAKQKAEEAQAQADSFRKALEKLKSEKQAELDELTEKVVDQNLELEEAKEEKALLEADKDFLREQVQGNLSKISEQGAKISEQENQIRENEAKISKNEAFMEQQNKKHEEQIDFFARRNRALSEIERVSNINYDDKNVTKILGKVTMDQKHYENLKKKAGFFSSIKSYADDLVTSIKETSVYKALEAKMQAEINKWKRAYQALKDKVTELEDKVDSQNDELFELYTERDNLRQELKEEQELREKIDKYLKPKEKEELAAKIERREKRHQEAIRQKRQDYWR